LVGHDILGVNVPGMIHMVSKRGAGSKVCKSK
jgi:hypothetical protein